VRERALRAKAAKSDDDYDDDRGPRWLRWARERPKDAIASAAAALAIVTILVNALFLQSGPHPAPIFANKPPIPPKAHQSDALLLPRSRPAEPAVPANPRPRADLIADIQRELAMRGFYDGAPDGVYGPKTDAAIRDFEQSAGLRPSAEPNDVLLQILTRSQVKAKPATNASRNDPIGELLAPNKRIVAVQRALTDYGYGQIKPTGVYGPETRAAIERFERERKLPVTGQVTERLTRELSAMSGRPID
jgi:peptidoglycan hydrolase-like protein with peptidoglycan-binding domain